MGLAEIKAAVNGIDPAGPVEVVVTGQRRINRQGGNTGKRQVSGVRQADRIGIVFDDVVVLAVLQTVHGVSATAFVADGITGFKVMPGSQVDAAAGGINRVRVDKPMFIGGR